MESAKRQSKETRAWISCSGGGDHADHLWPSWAIGAWGIAVGLLCRAARARVRLWSARAETGRLLVQQRENTRLLPGVRIPETIEADHRRRRRRIRRRPSGFPPYPHGLPSPDSSAHPFRMERGWCPPVISLPRGSRRHLPAAQRDPDGGSSAPIAWWCSAAPLTRRRSARACRLPSPRPAPITNWPARSSGISVAIVFAFLYEPRSRSVWNSAGRSRNVIGLAAVALRWAGLRRQRPCRSAHGAPGGDHALRGGALGAEAPTFAGCAGRGDLTHDLLQPAWPEICQVGERLAHGEALADIMGSMGKVAGADDRAGCPRPGVPHGQSTCRYTLPRFTASVRGQAPARDAVNDLMLRRPRESSDVMDTLRIAFRNGPSSVRSLPRGNRRSSAQGRHRGARRRLSRGANALLAVPPTYVHKQEPASSRTLRRCCAQVQGKSVLPRELSASGISPRRRAFTASMTWRRQ